MDQAQAGRGQYHPRQRMGSGACRSFRSSIQIPFAYAKGTDSDRASEALETQPQTKLHLAHRSGRADNAKAGGRCTGGRNGSARLSEVGVVEGIRSFSPEAQLDALSQTKVARDGQVDSFVARAVQQVAS